MELWIRSQDKERLLKIEDLFIQKQDETTYHIKSIIFGTIAKYSTKERALEVLDEIQNEIKQSVKLFINADEYYKKYSKLDESIKKVNIDTIVYEMPQD